MEYHNSVLVAYVPVLHEGYLRWFRSHTSSDFLFVLPSSYFGEERWIAKDIRALATGDLLHSLQGFRDIPGALVMTPEVLAEVREKKPLIFMPDDADMRTFASHYLSGVPITWESVFLRWDRRKVEAESTVEVDSVVSKVQAAVFLDIIHGEAAHSPDFWLQVGALAVRDNKVIATAYNTHMPHEHTVYAAGDPRMFFSRGVGTDLSCADHAERVLIGRAARDGVRLCEADLFLTVFPCPACAYQIVDAGFRTVYFSEGYSLLDAADILRKAGIALVRVQKETPD